VKNWQKTIGTEEKLNISWLEKAEHIVDKCHNVLVAHSNIHTVCDNADGIKESDKSGMNMFVKQDYHSPVRMNHTKKYGYESLT